jgi:cell wall-associated NlpC family hydrolase
MVFKISGYRLHRDAWQQATQGKEVKTLGEASPGDIVFFKSSENKITHTGILLGDDRIIHSSGKVRIDHINEEGILNLDTKVYTHSFSHIRRILA